jgi:Na+-translocating ferredoxin:NAD+ oxidoreductase RNF subunit RnfB
MSLSNKDKIKRIYETLPKMNCGLCGFESCAKFAKAVAEGQVSPFGCRQDPLAAYTISRIVGVNVPGELASAYGPEFSSLREALGQDIKRLYNEVDDILARIEKLKVGKQLSK